MSLKCVYMKRRFANFAEFWPFYVGEHAKPVTRWLHFIGSSCALACVLGAALVHWWLALVAPVVGYAFAWLGHFGFEGNRPATFKYPFYSFMADWVMWAKMLNGSMDAEVRRILASRELRARPTIISPPAP